MKVSFELNSTQLRLLREGLLIVEVDYESHTEQVIAYTNMASHRYNKLSEPEKWEALAPIQLEGV
jgi:hypothetical protein